MLFHFLWPHVSRDIPNKDSEEEKITDTLSQLCSSPTQAQKYPRGNQLRHCRVKSSPGLS